MSIFGNQLKDKIQNTGRETKHNLKALGDSVEGKKRASYYYEIGGSNPDREVRSICRFLKIEVPDEVRDFETAREEIDFILHTSGAIKRTIELSEDWWKDGDGPLLAMLKKTGAYIALFPGAFRGYYYYDRETQKKVRITKRNQDQFEKEAVCFYKPLPNISLSNKEYVKIILKQLNTKDILILLLSALFITLLGLITPLATKYAFSSVIPSGSTSLLIPLSFWLVSFAFSTWLLNVVKLSVTTRINTRLEVYCQNAVYSRVIRLPAAFFKDKSAGGMAQKVKALSQVPMLLTDQLFGTVLTVVLSLIYILQLFTIAAPLVLPVFTTYIAEIALFIWVLNQEKRITEELLTARENNSGLVFAFLSGIQKIKISGSRKQAFAKWLDSYTQVTRPSYIIRFPSSFQTPLVTAINLLGLLWIYLVAAANHLSVAQFTSFSSAFGMAMAGVLVLHSSSRSFSMLKPVLNRGKPILEAVPETGDGKRGIGKLTGSIELNQVSFRYTQDSPLILDEISLQIRPGEYVAIVGKSGCGKSTLLRLLLGFEEPLHGSISYDGLDLSSIDRRSLRRNIGTVMQDGQLFNGDIFYNIILTAPWLKMSDAWDAAEKAGVADDIRKMPMGMHTMVTESGSGISGGQKQRILIARAISPRPAILMLDEATSALDNITQKIVTDSMNQMECTRIVIAHRLSTIRECDRILVLDHGQIIEDGTYDELYKQNGLFTELVKRQILEEAI